MLTPQRMSTKIYGILSDGVRYNFLRLEGKELLISRQHELVGSKGFTKTYVLCLPSLYSSLIRYPTSVNFLDEVLVSALTSTPHCSPLKSYPATNQDLRREEESRLNLPPLSFKEHLRRPPAEYLVDDSGPETGRDDDTEEPTHYEIIPPVRRGPYPQV